MPVPKDFDYRALYINWYIVLKKSPARGAGDLRLNNL